MAAMRFQQEHRFILAKKYFGVRGTFSLTYLATHSLLDCPNSHKNVQITESLSDGNRSISLTHILYCSYPFVHILICSQLEL